MGFFNEGSTLEWQTLKPYIEYIKLHGIYQFLNLYNSNIKRKDEFYLWGDEIEYLIINRDRIEKNYRLSLNAHKQIDLLNCSQKNEYGSYMLEGSPYIPFGKSWDDLAKLQEDMSTRRSLIQKNLSEEEFCLTIPNFPLLGCPDSTFPSDGTSELFSCSVFTSDLNINPHNRFKSLTKNIRMRRGSKVSINVPIFMDKNTVYPRYEKNLQDMGAKDGCVFMDSMAFGMGMCCLQCTYQFNDIGQARYVNDYFVVLAPIMLALTAGTPIYRGHLVDTDARWYVISASVDDRTPYERGETAVNQDNNKYVIGKSRYDSMDFYISQSEHLKPEHNDLKLVYDEELYDLLIKNGIDDLLSKHVAHLFIRDPLVVYNNSIELDDTVSFDHWECIQSTNWQTVRFKPPSTQYSAGWRVEFRPMEVQLTDFENAAFTVFITIMTRCILNSNLNFYIPISKVDENMKRAHCNNSVMTQKFYWRKSIMGTTRSTDTPEHADYYHEVSIDTIMNDEKHGLISLIRNYFKNVECQDNTRLCVNNYLDFISKRASGELLTLAQWQRNFIMNNKFYNHDSLVTPEIVREMITTLMAIEKKLVKDESLLADFY